MLNPNGHIGNRIAYFRKNLGLKQKELAIIVGTKPKYLCEIGKERRCPSANLLARISATLEVPIKELTKKV